MARREFTVRVKVAILKRAGGHCEECGAPSVKLEIHHVRMDALKVEDVALTDLDGQALCKACHSEITRAQMPILNAVKRKEAKHLGARKETKKIVSRPKLAKSTAKTDWLRMMREERYK